MKKRVAAGLLAAVCALAAFGAGCGEKVCEHDFTHYIILEPECEKDGLLESICKNCGKKQYSDIAATGHDYADGVCTRCGKTQGGAVPEPAPEPDFSAFYTMKDVYERAKLLSYAIGEQEFFEFADDTEFTDIYIDGGGRLKLHADGIFANAGDIRKDFPCDDAAWLSFIVKAEIANGTLYLTDSMGNYGKIGLIADYFPAAEHTVVGATINLQNELLLLFNDNTVIKAGTLRSDPFDADDDMLLYERAGANDYAVCGAFDRGIETAKIPATHRGKPIAAVGDYAFAGCNALKSAILPSNVARIGTSAFKNCASLAYVVIPKNARIGACAFSGCIALETVFFCGTAAEWEALNAQRLGNDMLFAARKYYYSETEPTENKTLYWHYENGAPALWA